MMVRAEVVRVSCEQAWIMEVVRASSPKEGKGQCGYASDNLGGGFLLRWLSCVQSPFVKRLRVVEKCRAI